MCKNNLRTSPHNHDTHKLTVQLEPTKPILVHSHGMRDITQTTRITLYLIHRKVWTQLTEMQSTVQTTVLFLVLGFLIVPTGLLREASGQARTESNCNFGMVKGQKHSSCQVPIPAGCTVAQFPGLHQHWADISKGGTTNCQFDEQQSDWKTTIVGTCDTCTSDRCSARFSVVFTCDDPLPPATMQYPAP